jgi:hypothetical protein
MDNFDDELKRAFGGPKDLTAPCDVYIELECGLTIQGRIDKASAMSLYRDADDITKPLGTIRPEQDCVIVLPRSRLIQVGKLSRDR